MRDAPVLFHHCENRIRALVTTNTFCWPLLKELSEAWQWLNLVTATRESMAAKLSVVQCLFPLPREDLGACDQHHVENHIFSCPWKGNNC